LEENFTNKKYMQVTNTFLYKIIFYYLKLFNIKFVENLCKYLYKNVIVLI